MDAKIKISQRNIPFDGNLSDKLEYFKKKTEVHNVLIDVLTRKFSNYFFNKTQFSISVCARDFYKRVILKVDLIDSYGIKNVYEVDITRMSTDEIRNETQRLKEWFCSVS